MIRCEEKYVTDYVSYATAKLAASKGFDELCTHYFINDFQKFKHNGILYQHSTSIEDNNNILQRCKTTKQPHLCSAPLLSELQKWLRQKEIHVNIDFDLYTYDVTIINGNTTERIKLISTLGKGSEYLFTEYEEALDAGLQQGLNFIK